ncbi:MFS transporter [Streptomyces sp. NPDC002588]|uniref:MFS transporter n=1 Tax=Streptomyces sp. NPDC002588 TaxID=3154419 RepID=UPI0033275E14
MKKRYALRWYLVGAVTARTGDEMSGPALLLAAFAVTGSSAAASVLLAAATVAAAAGGPLLGALLDRARRPGRLLAAALCLHALGLTAVLLGLGRLPFPITVLLAVLTGLPGPAPGGGWTAQLPMPPTRSGPARAAALDAMTFDAAALAGPALAAVTAHTLGARTAVAGAAWLICGAAGVAVRLRGDPGRGTPAVTGPAADPARGRIGAGIRYVAGNRHLAAATLGSTVSCAAQGMVTACLPLLGARALGAAADGALLLSCSAAAALLANAALARRAPGPDPGAVLRGGALIQAGAAALAATGRPAPVVLAAVLAGTGEGPQLAALFAVRHREAPESLRAQIFTTGASVKITGFALGAAAAGLLAARSLPGALLTAAALQLLAARVTAVGARGR